MIIQTTSWFVNIRENLVNADLVSIGSCQEMATTIKEVRGRPKLQGVVGLTVLEGEDDRFQTKLKIF